MGRLDGKAAVITGAAQGIGALMAKAMAEEGARVLVTDVQDTANAVRAITDAGGTAQGLKVDVTSNDDLAAMVQIAKTDLGRARHHGEQRVNLRHDQTEALF